MLKASKLRYDISRPPGKVIETGQPLEIERKVQNLHNVPKQKVGRLKRLTKHGCIICNPEKIVHIDWKKE